MCFRLFEFLYNTKVYLRGARVSTVLQPHPLWATRLPACGHDGDCTLPHAAVHCLAVAVHWSGKIITVGQVTAT